MYCAPHLDGVLQEGPVQLQVEAAVVEAEVAMAEAEVVPKGCRQRPILRPEFML